MRLIVLRLGYQKFGLFPLYAANVQLRAHKREGL